ncbi:MAG TPA: acyl carrier protein [Longimicrobium sp.]|nr:acyl carrier protein [Longimicrobium sp.]
MVYIDTEMNEEEIKQKVREFVSKFFRGHELQDGEDMFATGYVNSMFAMQLVQFVESAFGITVESEDLELDNFRSIAAITALVQRKTAAAV